MQNTLIQKVAFLIQADLNQLLDKTEQPMKMALLLQLELEDALNQARDALSQYIVVTSQSRSDLAKVQLEVDTWQQRAEIQAKQQNEDGVRNCLFKKEVAEQEVTKLSAKVDRQVQIQINLQQAVDGLQDRLEEVRDVVQDMLAQDATNGSEHGIIATSHRELEEFEEQIYQQLDVEEARRTVLGEESDQNIDSELDDGVQKLMAKFA